MYEVDYLYNVYSSFILTFSNKYLVAGTSILFTYILAKLWTTGYRERGLPPGPPTTPFLGNALQFPKRFPHVLFV
jgi:hypothetical protein